MSTSGLGPPGAASYSSNTLHVGDGTWDSSRDDFLLPNLMGLNFATMRYNGMGNRFAGLSQYHTLILGHGVIAAITFIGLLPAAIFIARFYDHNRRAALKMHVYLQILVVFFSTIVIVLGWFAVGPERSLTNPHHGIGIAIYVCILVQFLYGWFMARLERRRRISHPTIPLKVWIHKLFGRAIALLAFVQIALGLALYGSPKYLFVLYALVGALLLFLYLALTYRTLPIIDPNAVRRPSRRSDYQSDYDESYVSGQQTDLSQDPRRRQRPNQSHWARDALAAAGVVGAYEWWKNRRGSKRQRADDQYSDDQTSYDGRHPLRPDSRHDGRPPLAQGNRPPPGPGYPPGHIPPGQYAPIPYALPAPPGPQRPPGDYPSPPQQSGYADGQSGRQGRRPPSHQSEDSWEQNETDEKFGHDGEQRQHTWRDRILGVAGGVAAYEGIKSIFGRKKSRSDGARVDNAGYRRPSEGHSQFASATDVSRVEAGQAPFSPDDSRRPHSHVADVTPVTPTRPPPRSRPDIDHMSYDDEDESLAGTPRPGGDDPHTLRDSIATLGAIAGFREWNRRRRERRLQNRTDSSRPEETEDGIADARPSQDGGPYGNFAHGARPSGSTVLTGPADAPYSQSNLHVSRQSSRPDTNMPPLPAAAGVLPAAAAMPPPSLGPNSSRHNVADSIRHQNAAQSQMFNIPPPPPGPPPNAARPANYHAPAPGSLQMPQGAIDPDPSRLVSDNTAHNSSSRLQDAAGLAAAATAGAAAAELAHSHHSQSGSPSRRTDGRMQRHDIVGRNSETSQIIETGGSGGPGSVPSPVSLSVRMHQDGRHVTVRRLNEEEAAAKKAAQRRDRRARRGSSFSSGPDEEPRPGPSRSRFRRNAPPGPIRQSSNQPITNIPTPPAMSSSALGSHRPPSELNLPSPPPPASAARIPQTFSPSTTPGEGLGSPPGGGYTTDVGTGTDVSAFDTNRRRRRAERARQRAAGDGSSGNRVAFEE